jgi:hypothetical protein
MYSICPPKVEEGGPRIGNLRLSNLLMPVRHARFKRQAFHPQMTEVAQSRCKLWSTIRVHIPEAQLGCTQLNRGHH